MSSVYLKVAEAEKGNKESTIIALNEIASSDGDFNGNNGKEFLWEEAEGYESNMDFVSKTVTGYTSNAIVYNYLSMWLGRDSYYGNYDYQIVDYPNDKILIIVTYTVDN